MFVGIKHVISYPSARIVSRDSGTNVYDLVKGGINGDVILAGSSKLF
ncbi:hypothetical protein C427_2017 [Paraglaciecola psychrophila 170]|uniref:Uncharacterized protein n=1 Tax=Paraglaciecola psychrophila 170 TaxID=1129794 RepID=M4RKN8_9ALTE|nr:hypothetical protein C427_2017 [Paraglaciecola psychrophila 170]